MRESMSAGPIGDYGKTTDNTKDTIGKQPLAISRSLGRVINALTSLVLV